MRALFRVGLALGLGLALAACDPNRVYEKNTDLDKSVWAVQVKPAFEFDVADTTQRYNIYFNIRNSSSYGYYNLYVRQTLTGPDGKLVSRRLHQMLLMDPKTGEPKGHGTGDIWDHQFLSLPDQHFRQPGTYKIVLEQYMRQDQLPNIMAVGVRVEKVAPK